MLLPKKVKYRKQHRGTLKGVATKRHRLAFGKYGLKTMTRKNITSRQIEAARQAITRHLKREGKLWIRVFPDKAMTSTPDETRMGGGKGPVNHYVAPVKPGTILFELDAVDEETAREALRLAGHKLPVKTKFITKQEVGESG